MGSQKSTAEPPNSEPPISAVAASGPASALEPKRLRGRLRVAAILDAGAQVFAERGYDAATMSEIAARSNTAIGSLYRFFPTKAVLGDALLARYAEAMGAAFDVIAARTAELSPNALADALVELMLEAPVNRQGAQALLDSRSDGAGVRATIRADARRRIGAILSAATGMGVERAEPVAIVLLQALKALPMLRDEVEALRPALLTETRALIRLYVARAFDLGRAT
jgi:AcrR family transcriptional regulator